jgi:hypothetical protein
MNDSISDLTYGLEMKEFGSYFLVVEIVVAEISQFFALFCNFTLIQTMKAFQKKKVFKHLFVLLTAIL